MSSSSSSGWDEGGLWCPECGAEYRPGFVECADCHVALVEEPPDLTPVDVESHDEPVVYDLTGWDRARREKLALLMRGAAIPVVWADGAVLSVPRAREADMDRLIDDVDAEPEPNAVADAAGAGLVDDGSIEEGSAPVSPPRSGSASVSWTRAATHRCEQPSCPYGFALTPEGGAELAVSWTVRDTDGASFVTLGDVLAAHSGRVAEIIAEHASTLSEAAKRVRALTTGFVGQGADDDLGAQVALENLADFAAELASWCLDRGLTVDGDSAWAATTAVMRAVVAMSALTDLIDTVGDPDT